MSPPGQVQRETRPNSSSPFKPSNTAVTQPFFQRRQIPGRRCSKSVFVGNPKQIILLGVYTLSRHPVRKQRTGYKKLPCPDTWEPCETEKNNRTKVSPRLSKRDPRVPNRYILITRGRYCLYSRVRIPAWPLHVLSREKREHCSWLIGELWGRRDSAKDQGPRDLILICSTKMRACYRRYRTRTEL